MYKGDDKTTNLMLSQHIINNNLNKCSYVKAINRTMQDSYNTWF